MTSETGRPSTGSASRPATGGLGGESLDVARAGIGMLAGLLGLVLALPVVVVLAPFWTVSFLTRRIAGFLAPRPVLWKELMEYAPVVGWKPRPNVEAHVLDLNHDPYHVTTDAAGWRGRGTLEESDVVVFGDSYAFGCGVDDDDFFPHLARDVSVKAIGAPGYSMVQPLLWMERLASDLGGKLVVWLVYLGNDLVDNLQPNLHHYRAPFVRRVGRPGGGGERWEIAADHVDRSPWHIQSEKGGIESYLEVCSDTWLSRRVFAACDALIERGRDLCRAAGARLVVMTVPELSPRARSLIEDALAGSQGAERFDEARPDREIGRICERHGVEHVALADHLGTEDYLERDFHWNPQGNRRVAEVIGLLRRSAGPERPEAGTGGDVSRAAAGGEDGDRTRLGGRAAG